MKKILFIILGVFLLSSCLKEEQSGTVTTLRIKAVLPLDYANADLTNVPVLVQNKNMPVSYQKNFDANGVVEFKVEPGRYSASVSIRTNVGIINGLNSDILLTEDGVVDENHQVADSVGINLEIAIPGGIIFREVYYGGTKTANGADYSKDQYFELYNNTEYNMYLDSLCFGAIAPANGQSNTFSWQGKDTIALFSMVWMVPGTGQDYPLGPGESAVIAMNAIDHTGRCLSNLDLSKAHFGIYYPGLNHEKAPDVPAMVRIIAAQGTAYSVSISSPAVVIFRPSMGVKNYLNNPAKWDRYEPGKTSGTKYWHIAKNWIFDGVECANGPTLNVKRLPVSVDAGFTYLHGGNHSGKVVTRKVQETLPDGRVVYQDTNNSTVDFNTDVAPSPHLKP